jgi:inorganic pyrophosphatase
MKDLLRLPARSGEGIHVVVETPTGSRKKLKYLPALGVIGFSRPLSLGLHYPFDWGFVPSTLAPDGDPLGPGRERNDRLLVLPLRPAHGQSPASVFELAEQTRTELADFFLWSTRWEGKDIRLLGWAGIAEADQVLREAERRVGS